jgi:DNA-binding MarR family transcriptional regulator
MNTETIDQWKPRNLARSPSETDKAPNSFGNHDEILLGVLNAIEQNASTSQRSISRELNVALGLANAYLKRGVRKGLIKIKQVPRRRYMYYLTPRGFAEKSRLTGEYFAASFNFFRRARAQMDELIAECAARGQTQIVFAGVSEMAEVGALCALGHPVKVLAIVDPAQAGKTSCGLPVKATVEECGAFDVVIITVIGDPDVTLKTIRHSVSAERVLAPKLLRLERAIAPASASSVAQAAE